MQLESLTCNNCGAPLQVPPGANFVTCASCGSQLAIKRTDTVAYTEVLHKLEGRTNQMETELRRLQLDNALEQIDRDWESERQGLLVRSRNGVPSEPTREGAMLQGVLIGGFSVVCLCIFASMSGASGMEGALVLIALLFVAMAAATAGYTWIKATNYERAYNDYLSRREAVYARHKGGGSPPPVSTSGSWAEDDEAERRRQDW